MRIALLTYSTKPRGGVVHTLALAEALAALGEQVDVWTLGRDGDTTFFRPVDPRVGVRAVPFPAVDGEDVGARIVRSIAVLRAAFGAERAAYDVVHAQDCISANAALPCLRTIHHLDQFTTPELAACHERAVVEPIGRICVSEAVAAEVEQGWGLRPTVIPNGVDADRFAAASGDLVGRARWRERIGGRYVLALGGIEPRKGSIDLLEAHAELVCREPSLADVRLVFGGGETLFDYRAYRADFEERAAALDTAPVVLGPVPDDDLPALVAEASALGFVSTKEGFGLAAMEALAAGVPVIARDLPVLREVFGDAVHFAGDVPGIARVLTGVLVTRPDPAPGRALAASYTWSAAARAHRNLYADRLRS
ncbi:glycosyl transferase family 1 [Nocardioides sp. Root190]|uniref:MSMEG_0565 family glycosyltransferase n=1 Tax=Nocardioides sp. Root190 TaxID=1736488 RepID=UPI0006F91CB8|nr:MSMEG_0565 family glycosyltransferase [Nocardioides sp. Root190]KRB73173.1 glycosyl transferase family 1 [Nocardioides sp. Root190]